MSKKLSFDEMRGQVQAALQAGTDRQAIVDHMAEQGWSPDEFRRVNSAAGTYQGPLGAVVQGMTLGAGDELKGAVRGGMRALHGEDFSKAYADEKATADAVQQNYARENPWKDIGLQTLGGAMTSAMAPMSVPATLGRAVMQGMGAGGLAGAIYGFNTGEGTKDRLEGAAAGGVTGAVLGGAIPPIMRAARTLGEGLRAWMPGGAERAASYQVGRALQRDMVTPDALKTKLAEAQVTGKQVTLADVGGANMQRIAEVAAQSPGEGSQRAKTFLEGRAKNQMYRLASDLKQATGTHKSAVDAIEETLKAREAAAKPLYDTAMQFPADQHPQIKAAFESAIETDYGKQAMRTAAKALNTEYRGGIDTVPYMVRIDAWKKAVDDLTEAAKRKGEGNLARVFTGLKKSVIDPIDGVTDVYRNARDAWGGPSQFLDAIDLGKSIEKLAPDEVAAFFRTASSANKDAFRTGAVHALRTKMGQNSAEMPDLTKVMKAPNMVDKIAAMMPDQQSADLFARQLATERDMAALNNKALRNSATAGRIAGMDDTKSVGIFSEMLSDLLSGKIGNLLHKAIIGVPGRIAEHAMPARNAEVARRVFETDPRLQRRILDDLGQRGLPSAGTARPAIPTGVAGAMITTDPEQPRLTGF